MRALLARAGALGDVLLLRRAIAALRRAGQGVTLLAPAAGAVLVGAGEAEVDRHLEWDARDAATLLSGERVPEGRFRAALAACDVALAYTRSAALVHGLARIVPVTLAFDPAPDPAAGHASTWFARPIAALGLDVSAEPPVHMPTDEETARAREWLARLPARFLAVHPGSGSPSKNWPFERFAALADVLAPDAPWLLILGPAEAPLEAELARPASHPSVTPALSRTGGKPAAAPALARAVVARDLPLRVLAAVLAQAGLYAGNDSGASHLAAACGAPTLALFGPTDPAVWAPLGPAVTTLRAEDKKMASLTVAPVSDAARGLWSGSERGT